MTILEYVLSAAFVLILVLYIIKIYIDKSFREKTIEYMKKQKSSIHTLEQEKTTLTEKIRELKSGKTDLQNQIQKYERDYTKIGIIIEKGIEHQGNQLLNLLGKSVESKSISKQQKEKIKTETQNFSNQINNMISWYQSVYGDNIPEPSPFEITEVIHQVINEVTAVFQFKHLTYINHIGEPINVQADQNMITYSLSTIATLLGVRSASGNTMYVDVERSGKKCLVTFEDSGPGDKDDVIRNMAGEKYKEKNLDDLTDFSYISFMMARDLIEKNGGKLWVSAIMEVGIKISFSIPIE